MHTSIQCLILLPLCSVHDVQTVQETQLLLRKADQLPTSEAQHLTSSHEEKEICQITFGHFAKRYK